MGEIIYNDEQIKAIETGRDFLSSNDESVLVISGPAGSGKSTITKEILKGIQSYEVIGMALAHSATGVLTKFLGQPCFTIAKGLGLIYGIDNAGEEAFTMRKSPRGTPVEGKKVFLVDEASMIDDKYNNFLVGSLSKDMKLIYLGDIAQLQPPGSGMLSPAFNYRTVELNRIMRNSGNISELNTFQRDNILKGNEDSLEFPISNWYYEKTKSSLRKEIEGITPVQDPGEFINLIVEKLNEDDSIGNVRVVAFTNGMVEVVNNLIRQARYKDQADKPFILDEILIIYNNIGDVTNNQTVRITKVLEEHTDKIGIEYVNIQLSSGSMIYKALTVDGKVTYKEELRRLKKLVRSGNYKYKNDIRDLRAKYLLSEYGYCSTSHKSQGETYGYVFVHESDILGVTKPSKMEKLQSLYVACSRPREHLYIFNRDINVSK